MPYKDRKNAIFINTNVWTITNKNAQRALDRSPDNKLHFKKLFFDPVIYLYNQLERFQQL